MMFELLPAIDAMLALYQKPRTAERFNEYLQLLQGEAKGDLAFPAMAFNPMAKEHIIKCLQQLKALEAEALVQEVLDGLNEEFALLEPSRIFKVALNVSDDLKGGWTNRYTSDYDSKFRLNALVKRGFCAPILWSSEQYTPEVVKQRTREYALRCIYWLTHPERPETLEDHINQERFVATHAHWNKLQLSGFSRLDVFYEQHRASDNYHIIFNFLYGDDACKSLGFPCFGVSDEMAGYAYAQAILER